MELWRYHRALFASLVLTLLFALHYGLPLYLTSTYLVSNGITAAGVNFLYGVAAAVTLLSSIHLSRYLKRFHTYGFTFFITIAEIVITIAFALTEKPYLLALFFITHFLLTGLLFITVNVFIETFTPKNTTGAVRGIFLTLLNIGILIAPFLGGLILANFGPSVVYLVAAAMLIPFLFFLHHYLREVKDPHYRGVDLVDAARRAMRNRNLRGVLTALFLLESFYIVMVIYMPIYITRYFDITLPTYMTVIMPIALLPLVLLPYELGYLADKKYGEKELLILGLSILSISLFAIGFMKSSSLVLWAGLLFFSRVGAALVETMTYSYYFKKIHPEDSELTTLFGNVRSVAIIITPLLLFMATPLITSSPEIVFFALAIGIILSLHTALVVKDTR